MAQQWVADAIDATPGILDGVSKIMYAEKGISTAPVTYVSMPDQGGFRGNTLLYVALGIGALVVVILLMKK